MAEALITTATRMYPIFVIRRAAGLCSGHAKYASQTGTRLNRMADCPIVSHNVQGFEASRGRMSRAQLVVTCTAARLAAFPAFSTPGGRASHAAKKVCDDRYESEYTRRE
ncbi:hypothetical protein A1F94_013107 [Pyrenophora tritici-repentis]|uniref:Uncharacterized protein n=1 Tax=Pyrenophora tritici-repentis TaxID=45151 RepID=A0A2W1DM45_9PLEO|nr:hypothetical protein A1F99_125540 [Pyrenophora tritici-repentis]KAF7568485.1 hypothetical protein PtrM4_130980 [Pyrenophora tritici-repentis]KAG9376560.1 hypothetical protein A1F94_013107 [Pyrenophora tritici-repentis]KAI2488116.1 hypothetical protein Ptr902_02249 [Pyrenophora tritici-repentis]PZC97880.1 hypothetical protein A1F95_04449 [Pyrenophora tritici-repentis]